MLKIDVGSELFGHSFFGFFGDMRVNIHRCLNVRVSEPFLHFLDRYSGFKKQAAMSMARPLELTGDPLLFRLTGIRLPPGHYTGLRLRAAPSARVEKVATKTGWIDLKPSELYLRGWRLVRLPAAPVSTALAAPSPEHP